MDSIHVPQCMHMSVLAAMVAQLLYVPTPVLCGRDACARHVPLLSSILGRSWDGIHAHVDIRGSICSTPASHICYL